MGTGWQADKERGRGGWEPGTRGLCQGLLGCGHVRAVSNVRAAASGAGHTRGCAERPGWQPPCPGPGRGAPRSSPHQWPAAGQMVRDRLLVPGLRLPQGHHVPPRTSPAAATRVLTRFQAGR